MNRDAYDEMRALEDQHWWFRGRRSALREHVKHALASAPRGPVLDVGSGTGATLAWLAGLTDPARLIGLEPEARALELARGRGLCVHLLCADATRLPFARSSVALVLCLDVLEHIEDDAAACLELARVLPPGGQLIVTVPAGPGLWSGHDVALGHRRRYARGELEGRLEAAGFEVEARHGFMLALWPLVWLVRRWRRTAVGSPDAAKPKTDFSSLPRPVNLALAKWLAIESRCQRALGIGSGVSLVIRARRR